MGWVVGAGVHSAVGMLSTTGGAMSFFGFWLYKEWKRLRCLVRLRERERAPDPREKTRLCRYPRFVGQALRVPRTHATLQLVAGTGWQHPVLFTCTPLLLSKVARPLAQLGVRPPMIGWTLASEPVARPGTAAATAAKEKERSGSALLTTPVQNLTWPSL